MSRFEFILFVALATALGGWTWTDDSGSYVCSASTDDDPDAPDHEWLSIQDTGVRFPAEADRIPLDMRLDFYGVEYEEIGLSLFGEVALSGWRGMLLPIPDSRLSNGFIRVLQGADLGVARFGFYDVREVDGRRRFVAEWVDFYLDRWVDHEPPKARFQVELEEGTNAIFFHFDDVESASLLVGSGIENQDGTDGVELWWGAVADFPFSNATIVCVPTFDGDGDRWTVYEGDCDDSSRFIAPDAREICDGIDNDCDGEIDEGHDDDGDGFTWCAGDCDERDAEVHPGSPEICDGIDNDCDGETPDGSAEEWFAYPCDGADDDLCDGGELLCEGGVQVCSDDAISSTEVCNGRDDDCDGEVDEGTGPTWMLDADGDGYGCDVVVRACERPEGYVALTEPDCDDGAAFVYPGAEELCDGLDNDCNHLADDGLDLVEYWPDLDGDGFGAGLSVSACVAPEGHVDNDDDCDDGDNRAMPGEVEACDGIDNDCDGDIDDGGVCDIPDADGDGVADLDDNCSNVANTDQADLDEDGEGDACDADDDGDGVRDADDNCGRVPNPYQEDLDSDGFGDACDTDRDGDGLANADDNCPDDPDDGCLDPGDADPDGGADSDISVEADVEAMVVETSGCSAAPVQARSFSLWGLLGF